MMRRKCRKYQHRWIVTVDGHRPPWQFCKRWFCDGAQPDPNLSLETQMLMRIERMRELLS